MQIKIHSDALLVTQRLKQIDENYFVVYNTSKNRYELHHKKQIGNTYCLACPYPFLDERFINLAQKTKIENSNEIIEQIEKHNLKIEKNNIQNLIEQLGENI